jgi:hypothetical protein
MNKDELRKQCEEVLFDVFATQDDYNKSMAILAAFARALVVRGLEEAKDGIGKRRIWLDQSKWDPFRSPEERALSKHREQEDRMCLDIIDQAIQRIKDVDEKNLATGCHRSHPHEEMDAVCQLKAELAQVRNENAQLRQRLKEGA